MPDFVVCFLTKDVFLSPSFYLVIMCNPECFWASPLYHALLFRSLVEFWCFSFRIKKKRKVFVRFVSSSDLCQARGCDHFVWSVRPIVLSRRRTRLEDTIERLKRGPLSGVLLFLGKLH